jgi:peptidoglycan/LPS O-acetylase OafA/YrhL
MIAVEPVEAEIAERTKTARFYRPELDVVRFFAFAAVFLHHQLPGDETWERNGIVLGRLSSGAKAMIAGTANAFGFGLYVFHWLAIQSVPTLFVHTHGYLHFLLCFISAGALTVMLAALSYRFLELPFLRIKERFEIVPSRLA